MRLQKCFNAFFVKSSSSSAQFECQMSLVGKYAFLRMSNRRETSVSVTDEEHDIRLICRRINLIIYLFVFYFPLHLFVFYVFHMSVMV